MKLTALVTATAATAALALTPTAAHAESKARVDPAGDMGVFTAESESDTPDPAPGRAEGDITGVRVTHLDRTVRLALTYRALNRVGVFKFFAFRLVTDKGVRQIGVSASQERWRGEHEITNGRDKPVACAGLTHQIDYVNDKLLIVIPRTCLGSPRWVRAAAFSGVVDQEFNFFVDDAYSSNYWGETPVYGYKVRRG